MLRARLVGLVTEKKLIKMHRVRSFKILNVYLQQRVNYRPVCKLKVLMPFLFQVQHNPTLAVLTRDTNKPERERVDTGSS